MQFRPCIDLHNGQVKQIVGGTLRDGADAAAPAENFVSDLSAQHYAEMYHRDNLQGGHVIKLGPGNEEAAIAALRQGDGTAAVHAAVYTAVHHRTHDSILRLRFHVVVKDDLSTCSRRHQHIRVSCHPQ